MKTATYPDQYLHVRESRSGETWIVPITDTEPLNLETLVDRWIANEYGPDLKRDGGL